MKAHKLTKDLEVVGCKTKNWRPMGYTTHTHAIQSQDWMGLNSPPKKIVGVKLSPIIKNRIHISLLLCEDKYSDSILIKLLRII